MTAEQQALDMIKNTIRPHVQSALDEFQALLADVPEADLGPLIYGGIAKTMVKTLQQTDLSESAQWALPFAFAELLRERMRESHA